MDLTLDHGLRQVDEAGESQTESGRTKGEIEHMMCGISCKLTIKLDSLVLRTF